VRMMSSVSETVSDLQLNGVEAYEWLSVSSLSGLVAYFARLHILLTLFDGNPDKWLELIDHDGTPEEQANDRPFAEQCKRRIESDPLHLERMRMAMREISTLYADHSAEAQESARQMEVCAAET
jgi:hypothetical protein